HPDYEVVEDGEDERLHTGRLVPVYSTTEGLHQRALRRLMWSIVEQFAGGVAEILPEPARTRRRLAALAVALRDAHFPENENALATAHRILAFDDFLVLQLCLAILCWRTHGAGDDALVRPGVDSNCIRAVWSS